MATIRIAYDKPRKQYKMLMRMGIPTEYKKKYGNV
jgi:hypothetical protein